MIKDLRKTLRSITSRWKGSLRKSSRELNFNRNSWNKETHWNSNEKCSRCDCSLKLRSEIMHLRWPWRSEEICLERLKRKRISNGRRSKKRLLLLIKRKSDANLNSFFRENKKTFQRSKKWGIRMNWCKLCEKNSILNKGILKWPTQQRINSSIFTTKLWQQWCFL